MAEEYTEGTDDAGNRVVVLPDGKTIPVDAENPEFCDFLNSLETVTIATVRTHHPQKYFCRKIKNECLEHVRKRGLLLSTKTVGYDAAPELSATSGISPFTDDGFQTLCCAVASNETSSTDGLVEQQSRVCVSQGLLDDLNDELSDERSDVRRLSSWKVQRAFVYIDVSDFSRFPAGQQALIVASIGSMTSDTTTGFTVGESQTVRKIDECFCIGDGYIYCFESSLDATLFAVHLACDIEHTIAMDFLPVGFHFRIGVHVGLVYQFWDFGRKGWNYVGDGINDGSRILEAIGKETDDIIFVSDDIRKDLLNPFLAKSKADRTLIKSLIASMQNRGRRKDKHGKMRRVYELNHMNVTS